jgi:hypothetical protein
MNSTGRLLQRIGQAIKDQFQDSLTVEDRKPIYQYQYNADTTFIVLAPKYEFYHQLVLVSFVFSN